MTPDQMYLLIQHAEVLDFEDVIERGKLQGAGEDWVDTMNQKLISLKRDTIWYENPIYVRPAKSEETNKALTRSILQALFHALGGASRG